MSVCLVSIHHPVDESVIIPFLGSAGPFKRIAMQKWQVESIKAEGFVVEVHEDPYDEHAVREAKTAKLVSAMTEVQPEVAPEVQPEVAPKVQPEVAPEVAVDEEITEETPVDDILSASEEQSETAEGQIEMTEEDLEALKKEISEIKTLAEANAIVAKYGFELDASVTRLKDIKAALLSALDSE